MKRILFSLIAMAVGCNTALAIDANTVEVKYNGSSATVTIASNISSVVTVSSGTSSHVKLVQSASFSGNSTGEITYVLSGSSTDGEFYLEGSYKCSLELNGVTLTNPSGPAVNIQNGKRIKVTAKSGTTSTLTDGVNEDYNGCFHCKGHTELKGKGTLNIVGNSRHGLYSKEYIQVKNLTLNITAAVKDGIHCKEYLLMESGTVNISGVKDDGIQVEVDNGATITQATKLHEDENSGNFYMEDGTLTVNVIEGAGEHVKADGTITYSGGKHTFITTSGIEEIVSGTQQASVVYDLCGRRVGDGARGVAIVRDGGRSVKRLMR